MIMILTLLDVPILFSGVGIFFEGAKLDKTFNLHAILKVGDRKEQLVCIK